MSVWKTISKPGLIAVIIATSLAPVTTFGRSGGRTIKMTISAAISLSESLQTLKNLYQRQNPGVSIVLDLGASGILQQQIEEGAPVDIFISASPKEMNDLEKRGLLMARTRQNLLSNALVLICPSQEEGISTFKDLTLPRVKRVAIANPESVPAGTYAKETLEYFNIYNEVRSKIIRSEDVRQALAYVETGNVDAALVYSTEAKLSSKVRVVATAPRSSHAPILYPIAVLRRSRQAVAAEKLVRYLAGPEGLKIFERQGFEPATQ